MGYWKCFTKFEILHPFGVEFQVEIDEHSNYAKALAALNASREILSDLNTTTSSSSSQQQNELHSITWKANLIESFLDQLRSVGLSYFSQ